MQSITYAALVTVLGLCTAGSLAACGESEPELTPQQKLNREFNDLTWALMEPLDASLECAKVGLALKAWEEKNGARYQEIVPKLRRLGDAHASNYQTVKNRFMEVAGRCVNPKTNVRIPQMVHDDNVARVYAMFPDFTVSYELR